MRVAILGNSGSGKSTLARWMANRAGLPSLDLDTLAWEPNQIAVARQSTCAEADVREYCESHASWVVEGCYANLVRVTLRFGPRLLFLNPGEAQCLNNCLARPWEPHKYASKAQQDEHLRPLLSWVSEYYTRDGEMSLFAHTACFNSYAGPREELNQLPGLETAIPGPLPLLRSAENGCDPS